MKAVVPGGPGSEGRGDQPAVGSNGGDKALGMEAGATELGGIELAIEPGSIVRGGNAALAGIVPPYIIVLGGSEFRGVKQPCDIFVPGGIDVGGIVRGGLKSLCII